MNLTLPPRKDGAAPVQVSVGVGEPLVILGANGAGKTRFTSEIIGRLGEKALRLNALGALYNGRYTAADANDPSSLRGRFSQAVLAMADRQGSLTTIELLLSQLMHDELLNLINYKLRLADGAPSKLKSTRLDRVVEIWQEVFPTNRVLIDSGKMLFSRGLGDDGYSAVRLSDGERAVLYYAGAILYAPKNSVIFVDSPELFLHPTVTTSLWNRLEALRSDCAFCYTTHDPEFASSRNGARFVWVRDCDSAADTWEYEMLPPTGIPNEVYSTLTGSRKPVLFIEGDSHSIDARLYPLIFPDFTVRSLGSCNKVIESTRTLNDLTGFHKVDSMGIVDRDRRTEDEVGYLRRKRIMVPEVAEVENIFILEPIVRAMAKSAGKDPNYVFGKVRKAVMHLFRAELYNQALQHTRHRVKRTVEYRVDARFDSIDTLEKHLAGLVNEMAPRRTYDFYCKTFQRYVESNDYQSVLRVFNMKSMLSGCNVAQMCGFRSKDDYIKGVINTLRSQSDTADAIRKAVRDCLKSDMLNDEAESK